MASATFSISPLKTNSCSKHTQLLNICKTKPTLSLTTKAITNSLHSQKTTKSSQSTTLTTNTCKCDISTTTTKEPPLKIAIVGFGNFGQFIAKGLRRQGHEVLATSRSDYSQYCKENGMSFYKSIDDMCEEKPDIVLFCCSILSTETMVRSIPVHKLKPDTIFVDVLSVKQFPRNLFLEVLPSEFGILCTHPMFGPESGKNGWDALPFVYEAVRVSEGEQAKKCTQFLSVFEKEVCANWLT